MKISILMLTYNAPKYVYETISTLRKVTDTSIPYELIVVDNNSHCITKFVDKILYKRHFIDKIKYNNVNQLFAGGNNTASLLAADDSTHYLLLNSDVRIKDPHWLDNLVRIYPKNGGASAYGYVDFEPKRADGYCLLIDRGLYDKYKLDEDYAWWWSVTKLEGQLLADGYEIVAVKNHENQIHHYGGKSGKGFKNAKGMNVDMHVVQEWFSRGNDRMHVIERL